MHKQKKNARAKKRKKGRKEEGGAAKAKIPGLTCLAAKFHPATTECAMATASPLVPGAF